MTLATTAQESGALSLDQAIAAISEPENQKQEPSADTPEEKEKITETEPAVEDASEAETQTDGESAETEEPVESEELALPAINPPHFWDAASKERFGEMPRDLQELVLAKEVERDKATSKALQDAAEKRKAADGEASKLAQHAASLDKLIPQAVEQFKGKYDGVDWNHVIDQYGADQALKLQNDMRAEEAIIQQLRAAKEQAEQVQFTKFVEAETAKLPELAPDLVDPKLGQQRKIELGKFLVSSGVPAESIRRMSALETALAYDAYRWRQAQAQAKAKASDTSVRPKPATQSPRQTVKPTAALAQRNPQSARLQTLTRKSSLTIDEAVELANLKEASP